MTRVRKKAATHQRSPKADIPSPAASVNDRSVAGSLIQALILLGLKAVEEALQQEVVALAGSAGSVFLLDQNVPLSVPRGRDVGAGTAVPLATYAPWQTPRTHEVDVFRPLWGGISSREDEGAVAAVPEAFGLATSRVSRRVIRASATARQTLQERRHDDAEWLVLVLDGTSFASDPVVIALGVTATAETRLQARADGDGKHARVGRVLARAGRAWVHGPGGVLVVLDGAKGLRAAVRDVCGDDVPVQRDR